MNHSHSFLVFGVALIVAMAAAPFVMSALLAAKSRQTISQHIQEHAHKQGTPTMGGIIVLIGVVAAFAVGWSMKLAPALLLVLGFGLIGFADDYLMPRLVKGSRGFDWKAKLVLQILFAGFAVWSGVGMDFVAIGIGVFVILFFSNAYNFSDGLDTLAGGIGGLLSLGLIGVVLLTPNLPWGDDTLRLTMVATMGFVAGLVPFLYYNAPPARVFMGDVGSLPLGALIGLVWYEQTKFLIAHLGPVAGGAMILFGGVMLVELLPPPLQVFWVKVFKKRFFNFKTPVHHAFQEKGWPETRIIWLFHLGTAVTMAAGLGWLVTLAGRYSVSP